MGLAKQRIIVLLVMQAMVSTAGPERAAHPEVTADRMMAVAETMGQMELLVLAETAAQEVTMWPAAAAAAGFTAAAAAEAQDQEVV